jgi:hypothetical protein
MKNSLLVLLFIWIGSQIFAQESPNNESEESKHKPVFVGKAKNFYTTPPLTEIAIPVQNNRDDGKPSVVKNIFFNHEVVNPNPKPYGVDPAMQTRGFSHRFPETLQSWDGMNSFLYPPDPTGAAGPNHYVQMVNTEYQIFDKEGNSLFGPVLLGTLLGGQNAGDPIALYDKDADRWFLSQFSFSNSIFIAISQTPDPLGEYFVYEFEMDDFPDYPKYAIWRDGYYFTANKFEGNRCYALERDKMLAGDPDAAIQGFNLPQLNEGFFFGVLPTHAEAALPAEGTPNYFVYMQDDNWPGVSQDHIKVWELSIDWDNPDNSNMSNPIEIPCQPFNTTYSDIKQPNTTMELDAFNGFLMYMTNYRDFGTHKSIVLNFSVQASGPNNVGIRWMELRKYGDEDWIIYQEGTYAPNDENRWMGSIHMDYQGNIALAYQVAGEETYLSLRATGRYASDPPGEMTLEEMELATGTYSQTVSNRNGDYSHLTIDPSDDYTFWFTGQYLANVSERKTKIVSFKIASDPTRNIGVSTINNPINGLLTDEEEITVSIHNYGIDSVFNYPVSYTVNNGDAVTEIIEGHIVCGRNQAPYLCFTS